MKSNRLSIILGVGVGLTVALLWVLGETGPVAAVPAATTRYVEPSGTDSGDCSDPGSPCQTIQYAVGKAVAGDTIDVAAGTYNENVTIDRSLTLQGTGAGRTIADGNGSVTHQHVMTVTVGSVVIVTGMTITNGKTPDGYPGSAGGGIHNAGTLTLDYCTVSGNTSGDGSGIHITGGYFGNLSSVALTNTILASHSVGVSVTEGNTVTVNGVLWHDAPITVSRSSTATVIVQNQHVGDPAFAPDGYHLTADSAAIDKGVYTDVPTDIDGDARPYGAASNLGADEYVSALHVAKEASSNAVLAGALLTYTLHVTVTDTLPTGIAAGRTSDGTAVLSGEQITWTPIITTPGGVWTERLIVTVASDHTGPLTNLIEVATEEGARSEDSVTVSVSRCIYVPLVLRGYQP
jgi:hypothetical protein